MIVRLLASLCCCCFFTQLAFAEMPVEINSTAPDFVGLRLVYALKEGIRSSNSLGISFDQSKPRMQLNVSTIDRDTTNPGTSTVYSVVILWNNPDKPLPLYLVQLLGQCGSSRVQECADGIVANVSEEADRVFKLFQAAPKR